MFLINITVKLGKKLFRGYINKLRKQQYPVKSIYNPSYSTWLDTWYNNNKDFALCLKNDGFYTMLGAKFITILENCDFIDKIMVNTDLSNSKLHSKLTISNK